MIKYLVCACMLGLSPFWIQPALATPQDQPQNNEQHSPEDKKFKSREEYRQFREQRKQEGEHRRHRDKDQLRAGSTLPEQYRYADYQVDYTQHPKLTPPTRYQQWIKINRQYLLMNVLTNTIIKVVPE